MQFEWHKGKSRANEAKHDLSFDLAIKAFEDPFALFEFNGTVDGEDRYHVIGLLRGELVILVVYTTLEEEATNETYRIISARKASKGERKRYAEAAH